MKVLAGLCAGMSMMLLSGAGAAVAQDSTGVMPPPNVLVIEREFLKPGKTGSVHEKSESAFVNAVTAAKWPDHYLAMTSMSGKSRALFMFGYASFEDWEKSNKALEKNAALSAAIDRASVADGELQDEFDQAVFVYDPDNSLRAGDVVHSRYFEITGFHVKPGHRDEFIQLAKMYRDGFANIPSANWALFDGYYGEPAGYYLAISKMMSLAEDDVSMNDDKKFSDAVGPEKMKKIRELTASCLDSSETNLFEFSPRMSYPADTWIKADPFWKPKAGPTAAKKPASPAQ